MDYAKEALRLHGEWKGKIEVKATVPVATKDDLSLAYTPGVAAPCLEIQAHPEKSYDLTRRHNLCAVITDGSAVLGLGDIGPEAGMPVMEGKCVLFKAFGDVDAFPLCVKTKDMGETGELITNLISELQGFDASTEQPKGIFGFFKKTSNSIEQLKTRYDSADKNVERIKAQLEDHQVTLMKDITMLDKMYELNLVYFKELTMYILAGKKKLAEVRANDLKAAQEKAQRTQLPEDAQAARDLADLCDRFEKKLYDLELTRNVSIQMGPQIRLIQSNDTMMAEKIQTTIVNTIPLWKNQMVLALGIAHSQQAMQAERAVTDATNELLKKNAATLKQGTIEIAKESERGIVDIETLQQTNKQLIETLDELNKIRADGKAKRANAEQELGRIEGELRQKMLEINN